VFNIAHKESIYAKLSWSAIFKIIGMLLSYAVSILLIKNYGIETYGTYSLVIVIISLLSTVSVLGIDSSIVRIAAQNLKEEYFVFYSYKNAIYMVFIVSSFIALIYFSISNSEIESLFQKSSIGNYTHIVAIGIVLSSLTLVNASLLRGYHMAARYSLLRYAILPLLFIVSLLLIFALQMGGITLIMWAYLLCIFIVLVISHHWIKSLFLFKSIKNNNKCCYSVKKLFFISIPMLFTGLSAMIISWTDMLMIGSIMGDSSAGIYNMYIKISLLIGFPIMIVNTVFYSIFSKAYGDSDELKLRSHVRKSSYLMIISGFVIVPIVAFFSELILISISDELALNMDTYWILFFAQFATYIFGPVGIYMNSTGNEKILAKTVAMVSVVNILLNYFLIPVFGMNGAAVSSFISMFLMYGIPNIYVYRKFGYLINGYKANI
jgi:O-antigen/teichoic acid export membrane protein